MGGGARPYAGPPSPRRSKSRRGFSKPPSLSTVWEWQGEEMVAAVPSTDDVMHELSPDEPMRGPLALRTGPSFLRLFGRRSWSPRYALLQPATAASNARLLLFSSEAMEELHEELLLLPPLHLQCLPADSAVGPSLARFSVSIAGGTPIELAAQSDEQRQRWIFLIGESMRPSPTSSPASSPLASPLLGGELPSNCMEGKVCLKQCKVSDNYRMGKVLAQGEDYLVVEGQHLATNQSHALKLLSKHSAHLRRGLDEGFRSQSRVCTRLLSQCLEELYEGPNHVCIVMRWGTHELDSQHQLAAAVLQALRLLRELIPEEQLPTGGLLLQKADAQRLLLRAVALDCHLQSNLFI